MLQITIVGRIAAAMPATTPTDGRNALRAISISSTAHRPASAALSSFGSSGVWPNTTYIAIST
jgi:hypothetical protein